MTLKQIREFMIWLRKEKFSYRTLSIGGVMIDGVVDGKIERVPEKIEPRQTMYEQYGNELLQKSPAKPSEAIPEEAMLE